MTLAQTERHIGQTKVRLTTRGKIVFGTLGLIAGLLILALINVNLFTPSECRDGLLNIKKTDECRIYLVGAE